MLLHIILHASLFLFIYFSCVPECKNIFCCIYLYIYSAKGPARQQYVLGWGQGTKVFWKYHFSCLLGLHPALTLLLSHLLTALNWLHCVAESEMFKITAYLNICVTAPFPSGETWGDGEADPSRPLEGAQMAAVNLAFLTPALRPLSDQAPRQRSCSIGGRAASDTER